MGLHSKLAEVMGEVGRIPKNGRNDFHGYDYVLESDLVEAVRQRLASRQVMLYPSVEEVERTGTITTVRVRFTAADGESGETFEFWGAGSGDDKSDKGIYKALTGAEKYALMKLFLIATGDDPEADRAADKSSVERSGRTEPTRRESAAPSGSSGKSSLPPSEDETTDATSPLSAAPEQSDAGVRGDFGEGSLAPPVSDHLEKAHTHDWQPAPNPDAAKRGFHVCKTCGISQKDPK